MPGTAWAQDNKPSKRPTKPTASASKKTVPRAALIDGQAETRLLAIYQLIGQGQQRQALTDAENLVRDHPNFQLAQLVLGDLLAARARPLRQVGAVPGAHVAGIVGTTDTLSVLREESRQRLQAQHARPPANTIPAQFLALSPRQRHAVAVDASRSQLGWATRRCSPTSPPRPCTASGYPRSPGPRYMSG